MDDFSRVMWIYLIKSRNEIFSIFREFYAYVRTQFDVSIKTLCSDNTKEYFFADFTKFLCDRGIVHESSCACTPQKNGIAERKNHHLLDVTCTMMLHYNVPLSF